MVTTKNISGGDGYSINMGHEKNGAEQDKMGKI